MVVSIGRELTELLAALAHSPGDRMAKLRYL
jgi:hypothetical protein